MQAINPELRLQKWQVNFALCLDCFGWLLFPKERTKKDNHEEISKITRSSVAFRS